MKSIQSQCVDAYESKQYIATASSKEKNAILNKMGILIESHKADIIFENQKDIEVGKKKHLSKALLDRLTLNEERIQGMLDSINSIQALDDPIGVIHDQWTLANGLNIQKVSCPFGVIAMIYEARPNVTVDAITLAIKAGSSIVLRGSSSAYHSNLYLSQLLKKSFSNSIDANVIQLIDDLSRESVLKLIQANEYIDLVIPRGGKSLIQLVIQNATVPSIETGEGNCHIYVDKMANVDFVIPIILNAKTHRPSVCNACESVLIHQDIASSVVSLLAAALTERSIEIVGCKESQSLSSQIKPATDIDWGTEYLGSKISIKIVPTIEKAIFHINYYGSHHSDAIISEDLKAVKAFNQLVDSASVLHNASTRFTDGGEFGFGAEIGISTQKLHARGPFALREICSYKYLVSGNGQVRY